VAGCGRVEREGQGRDRERDNRHDQHQRHGPGPLGGELLPAVLEPPSSAAVTERVDRTADEGGQQGERDRADHEGHPRPGVATADADEGRLPGF